MGIAPYGVALSPDGKTAYVSNFGGRVPGANDASETSVGTLVAVGAHVKAGRLRAMAMTD